ncbi:putative periplasmic serine endoprotease DegP-like precursor [Polystyrenella longa]|uniref:Putative periplasmic serine endoprotease DegP-like n=1 Tax=Polystyrenella longa TaxID=2528007 RepID=A0A518CR27_9PLAN|nr:transglutaminase family protein [Polystyrenella longa]QDU81681.1 putative periplasmic serine endoprotease DegP-like precursor [Polystyrenella longa]
MYLKKMYRKKPLLYRCSPLLLAFACLIFAAYAEDGTPASSATAPMVTSSEGPAGAERPMPLEETGTLVSDMAIEELVARARESVVVITFSGRDGKQLGIGSGFVLESDGLIATNRHVIGDARPISVQFANGQKYEVAEVRATDSKLDLALLKINAKDLPALPVRFTGEVRDGESVIALGNPLGLKHSVVKGIISGQREVEGRNMLQLAIPIEQGNSGGPVLNQQGEVVGLVTLKSLASENLGFAVPASDLKLLIDKPNPIPMSRWLTIGRLDEEKWTDLFGATWRQRSGQIHVQGSGKGFGGRALLLSTNAVPEPPYEIAVQVKQDQTDGAAGIVFASNGEYEHYGFYPSGGRIRLSKFNGPDVLTWQVLKEIDSPLLQEDWNNLKVRVEEEGVLCYLNGEQVINLPRVKIETGSVGLAKFRDTTAQFKNFQLGKEVESLEPSVEVRNSINGLIDNTDTRNLTSAELSKQLLPHATFTSTLLEKKAAELERQAEQIRQLARDVHRERVLASFAEVLQNEDANLFTGALHISWLDNEELDITSYEQELTRLADILKSRFEESTSEAEKFSELNRFLFEELGFHGSRTNYYHRSNSYLNEVLDDREGLPISLSVLYQAVGKRIGLQIDGVGLPGHYVSRFVPTEGEPQLVDPFEQGKLLSRQDAELIVLAYSGRAFDDSALAAQTTTETLTRMLRNLLSIAQDKQEEERMLNYMHFLIVLDPESAEDRWGRALLAYRATRLDQAIVDIEWLEEQSPPIINPRAVAQLRLAIQQKQDRLNSE